MTIDFIGGILSTGAGTDLSYINAIIMKDDYAGRPGADVRRRAPPDLPRRPRSSASGSRRCPR